MKVGDILEKRFELRERLGGGGLGEVFRAKDSRASRVVTIKIFDGSRCSPKLLRGYEALLTAAVRDDQPGVILPRLRVALTATPPFVVSEALAGEDLGAFQARVGSIPWQRAVEMVQACAERLASLSASTGAAHRALKPGNVWIGEDGAVKLLDFGVAELGVQPVRPRPDGTVTEYRAPEQLEGGPGDARSDVFSLGVLLFELLTGFHPFSGPSSFKVAHRMLLQPAPRAREIAPAVMLPTELEALLLRALARQPTERWKDSAELARQFARVCRAPGAVPRPAALSSMVPPATETTLANPVSPEYPEDSTTALNVPALRGLLKGVAPKVPVPIAPPLSEPIPLTRTPVTAPTPPEDGPPLLAVEEPTAALALPTPAHQAGPRAVRAPPAAIPEITEVLPSSQHASSPPLALVVGENDDGETLAISTASRRHTPVAVIIEKVPEEASPAANPATRPIHVSLIVSQPGPAVLDPFSGPAAHAPPRMLIAINVVLGIVIVVIVVILISNP